MRATKQSQPSHEQARRMQLYDRIDRLLTKRESRSKTYRCPDVRKAVLAIGEQVK